MKNKKAIFSAFRNQNWRANPRNARNQELARLQEQCRKVDEAHAEQLKIDPKAQIDPNGQYVKFATAVVEQAPVENGLIALFTLEDDGIFNGEEVQYDVIKYSRKLPKGKKKNGAYDTNEVSGYDSYKFTPPKYKEQYPFNFSQIKTRLEGTTVYGVNGDREMAVMRRIASTLMYAKDKFDLGMTWQASQILQTGKIAFKTVGGSTETDDIDFDCPTGNFANSATLKIADLEAHIKEIQGSNNANYKIDRIFWGTDALNALLADSDNQKVLDNRRIDRGSFVFGEAEMNGFAPVGTYNFNGTLVTMYTFDSYYNADNGDVKSFIDPKNVVFMSSMGQYRRYFAGVDITKEINADFSAIVGGSQNITIVQDTVAVDMYFYTEKVSNGDVDGVFLKTASSPLLVPKTNNSFGCLTYTG